MRKTFIVLLVVALIALTGQCVLADEDEADDKPLKFARDLSDTYIGLGEYVTITYTVRNSGETTLTNIIVVDSLIGQIGSLDALAPGEKRTFSSRVQIAGECVSCPSATYELGGVLDIVTREPETIYLADIKLEALLEADKTNVAPGEVVTLRLTLNNTGNVPLSRLRLYDSSLGDWGAPISELRAGQKNTVTKTVQIKSTTTFKFTVTGARGEGSEVEFFTNELTVFATPVASDVKLTISAKPNFSELAAPGSVVFSLSLTNGGTLELRNVRLYEQSRGDVRTLLFVPVGDMPALTQSYEVRENQTFVFAAEVTDSAGDVLTVTSPPVDIVVRGSAPEATEAPESGPSPEATDGPIRLIQGASYRLDENSDTFNRLMIYTIIAIMAAIALTGAVRRFRRARARRNGRVRRRGRRKLQKRAVKRARKAR